MELPSFLALNASDRAFGRFHVGLSIKSYPDGKLPGLVASNDLNARDGLATGPLSDGLKALFPEGPVPQADCFEFRHGARRLREQHPEICGSVSQSLDLNQKRFLLFGFFST
jgi:hypothetical protein